MAVSWRISIFQKLACWNPYFYSVLGGRACWANLSKKGNCAPPKQKFLAVSWKALFGGCVLVFVGFFLYFWGGFVFLSFLCLLLIKNLFFPQKCFFVYFSVSRFVSPPPFLPPPFSLSLSLPLSSIFLSSFLFCFLFFPSCCLCLSLSFFFAFVSWKEQHRILHEKVFFHKSFLFLIFYLVFSFTFLSLIFVFSFMLSCVSCSTSMFFLSKKRSRKTPIFGQEGGRNKTIFKNLCFVKCEKLSFF